MLKQKRKSEGCAYNKLNIIHSHLTKYFEEKFRQKTKLDAIIIFIFLRSLQMKLQHYLELH